MKNSYEIRGDVAAIFIFYHGQRKECLIDSADLPVAQSIKGKWFATVDSDGKTFRCVANASRPTIKTILIHRLITNAPDGMEVDHIHHDGLDNRRESLLVCDKSTNLLNRRGAASNSTHGIRGAHFDKRDNRWAARVMVHQKEIHLGRFATAQEAGMVAAAYREKLRTQWIADEELRDGGDL